MNSRGHVALRIVAGCVLLGALVEAGLLWRQIAQVRDQLMATASQQGTIDASVTATRKQIAAQKQTLATARKAAAAVASLPAPAATGGNRPARVNVNALLEADPKLMALYLKSFRGNLSDRFGPLFQRLGLTPYQIGKWEDLATAQEQANVDLRTAAAAQGLNYAQDPGIVAMKKQSAAQLGQTFAAAVGADVAERINDGLAGYTAPFNGMVPMVTNIATIAAQNGSPMNYEQMGEVGAILTSNFTPNPAVGGYTDWNKIASQATTSLTGPQVDALRTMASIYQLSDKIKQFYAQQGGSP